MSKELFERFLRSRQQPTTEAWEAQLERWRGAVDNLYDLVGNWLGEYSQRGAVSYEQLPRQLVEEDLGRYEVNALRIGLQGIDVVLEPVGANIIGALGRVDMAGPAGELRLLLVPPDRTGPRVRIGRVEASPEATPEAEPVFKLATDPPVVRFLDLDQDLFLEALLYVAGARIQPPGE